jgi:hypothetical protein
MAPAQWTDVTATGEPNMTFSSMLALPPARAPTMARRLFTPGTALRLAVVASTLWAGVGHAHEGGLDARGTVSGIDAERITLRTEHGTEQAFALTASTEFVKGRAPAVREDVAPGMRAVVHARRIGDRLEARLVRVAAGKGSPR